MKKILLVAAASMVMAASCEKTQIINPVEDTIGFDSRMGKLTKAETEGQIDKQATLKDQGIKVWAYYAYEDATNGIELGEQFDDMNALNVTWDPTLNEDKGGWKTGKDYYWPGEGKKLNFFAVSSGLFKGDSPALPADKLLFENQGKDSDRTMTVKDYTVNHQAATDDLMVADFVNQDQVQNEKKVHLNFHHALSRVTFKFKTDKAATENEYITVNSITVAGLTTKGDLNVTETASNDVPDDYVNHDGTTTLVSLDWGLDETVFQNFVCEKDAVLDPAVAEYVTWLVIPQDIYYTAPDANKENKKVVINYTITSPKGDKEKVVTFDLGSGDLDAWGINQAITYTVNITPIKITFDPKVENWTPTTDVSHTN
jgi:hypothetical protein